jgi:hypothetical protein
VVDYGEVKDLGEVVRRMEAEMRQAAERLEFEKAARIRDRIAALRRSSCWSDPAARGGGPRGRRLPGVVCRLAPEPPGEYYPYMHGMYG